MDVKQKLVLCWLRFFSVEKQLMEAEKWKKKIRTTEPSATQPQSMQSTEKDKAVKNDHLCQTDHILNDTSYGKGWALGCVLWI